MSQELDDNTGHGMPPQGDEIRASLHGTVGGQLGMGGMTFKNTVCSFNYLGFFSQYTQIQVPLSLCHWPVYLIYLCRATDTIIKSINVCSFPLLH